jgi:hypothetical protein
MWANTHWDSGGVEEASAKLSPTERMSRGKMQNSGHQSQARRSWVIMKPALGSEPLMYPTGRPWPGGRRQPGSAILRLRWVRHATRRSFRAQAGEMNGTCNQLPDCRIHRTCAKSLRRIRGRGWGCTVYRQNESVRKARPKRHAAACLSAVTATESNPDMIPPLTQENRDSAPQSYLPASIQSSSPSHHPWGHHQISSFKHLEGHYYWTGNSFLFASQARPFRHVQLIKQYSNIVCDISHTFFSMCSIHSHHCDPLPSRSQVCCGHRPLLRI